MPELIIYTDQLTGSEQRLMASNSETGRTLAETISDRSVGEVFRLRPDSDHAFVYHKGEIVLEGTFAYIETELDLILPRIPQESPHEPAPSE